MRPQPSTGQLEASSPSETDRAYTAGIIDGEGCIGIYRFRDGRGPNASSHFQLIVTVSNTDKRMIDWLQEKWGGSVCAGTKHGKNEKDHWRWTVYQTRAGEIINACHPYLVAKVDQADVASEYLARRGRYHREGRRNVVSPELLVLREDFKRRLSELKGVRSRRD